MAKPFSKRMNQLIFKWQHRYSMQSLDSDNPVVRLCVAGSRAEFEQRPHDAAALYLQAWEARLDALDASVAAHYCARLQPNPEVELKWNEIALEQALASDDERMQTFYPSLYLSLGQSYARLSQQARADDCFRQALQAADQLEPGAAEMVRAGILAAHPQLKEP